MGNYIQNEHAAVSVTGNAYDARNRKKINTHLTLKKAIYIFFVVSLLIIIAMLQYTLIIDVKDPLKSYVFPLAIGVFLGYFLAKIKMSNNKLALHAPIDSARQTSNQHWLEQCIAKEIARSNRNGHFFSIIFFNIDYFEKIKERHSRQVSDSILRMIENIITNTTRASDLVGKWEQEKFFLLLNDTAIYGACIKAEIIRCTIEDYLFKKVGKITCSFGVTQFRNHVDSIDTLLECAHKALSQAKENGKNCVYFYEPNENECRPFP